MEHIVKVYLESLPMADTAYIMADADTACGWVKSGMARTNGQGQLYIEAFTKGGERII